METTKLSDTLPKLDADKAVKQFATLTAHLFYHLSKSVADQFGEEGKKAIADGVYNFGIARGERVRGKVEAAGLPLTMENEYLYHDLPIGSTAWTAESWDEGDNHCTNVVVCPFAQTWIELGPEAMELGKLYCPVDYAIWEGYNPDIKYSLSANVLDGAPHCTHVYNCSKIKAAEK